MRAVKKGGIVLTIFILMLSSVFATITVDNVPATVYNLGDKVVVSGNVVQGTNVRGYLGMGFLCGVKKMQTSSVYVQLKANEAQSFSQLLVVPQGVEGECVIQVTLSDVDGNVLENKNADTVTITSLLDGSFGSVPANFQLGDKLVIKGKVNKQDKTGVEGIATIYFKQNQDAVFIETTPIVNGEVNYVKDLSLIPPGSYVVDIAVADTLGNKNLFDGLYRFSINNNIAFDVTLDKNVYSPGEVAVLSGLVKSTVQSKLVNVDVEFTAAENVSQVQKLEDNTKQFVFKYAVPRNVKTGDHTVRLSAKDNTGNFGEKEVVVSVKAQPTALVLKLAQETAAVPQQNLVFEVSLSDQAGDPMQETVVAKLLNQKGEFEKSKLVQTQGQDFFVVPQGALPGSWKVELEGLGLSAAKTFAVKEQKALTIALDGEVLQIKNTGNVRFDESLAVKANDQESAKKLRLGLQDETKLALNQLFEPGTYVIVIPSTGQKFENVVIAEEPSMFGNFASSIKDVTGNVVSNATLPERKTSLLVLFIVVLVGLAFIFRPKGETRQRIEVKQSGHSVRDFLTARKNAKKLREEKVSGRAYRPEFGRADEKDVADFRDRMSKAWDEHQEQERREKSGFSYRPQPEQKQEAPKSDGGIFDIFKP